MVSLIDNDDDDWLNELVMRQSRVRYPPTDIEHDDDSDTSIEIPAEEASPLEHASLDEAVQSSLHAADIVILPDSSKVPEDGGMREGICPRCQPMILEEMRSQPWARGLEPPGQPVGTVYELFCAAAGACIRNDDTSSHAVARRLHNTYDKSFHTIALLVYSAPIDTARRFFRPKWHKCQGDGEHKPYELFSELSACDLRNNPSTRWSAPAGTHRFEMPGWLRSTTGGADSRRRRDIHTALKAAALERAKAAGVSNVQALFFAENMQSTSRCVNHRHFVDVTWDENAPPLDNIRVSIAGERLRWREQGPMLHPAIQIVNFLAGKRLSIDHLVRRINAAIPNAIVLDVWHHVDLWDPPEPNRDQDNMCIVNWASGTYTAAILLHNGARVHPDAGGAGRGWDPRHALPHQVTFRDAGAIDVYYKGRPGWCSICRLNQPQEHTHERPPHGQPAQTFP